MRRTLIPLLGPVLLTLAALAHGDQTDPRLDNLFAHLRATTDPIELRRTENQIWELWLRHDNPEVETLMQIGIQRMGLDDYQDALVIFSQIIASYPQYAEAWNKRATLYFVVGNLEASIADIEATLALEPRHFGALSGLGLVHLQRNELGKAKAAFEDLLAVHPHSANARSNLEFVEELLSSSII